MNTSDATTMKPPESHAYSAATVSQGRLMYWSILREFWENPSIYIAPLAAAAVYLVAYGFAVLVLSGHRPAHTMAMPNGALREPYDLAAMVVMLTVVLLQLLYCLDALYGERRERSILFWKSLPVSDMTTVLAKASIPMVILPLLGLAVTVVTQIAVLLITSVVVLFSGGSVATLWGQSSIAHPAWLLLYHLVAIHTFWYAPIYGWILFVSAWAKRAPIVWVVFVPLAIGALEHVAFGTSHFEAMIVESRLMGGASAMTGPGKMVMGIGTHVTPGAFLSNPGLWVGLAITAAFLYGAAWLRKYHEPI